MKSVVHHYEDYVDQLFDSIKLMGPIFQKNLGLELKSKL
jgi:hypothetical protein